ncbi:MAG: protein rep [Desulfuromonadales bacterium]|nr:protein rep [Desulfuromonadales bacterium]
MARTRKKSFLSEAPRTAELNTLLGTTSRTHKQTEIEAALNHDVLERFNRLICFRLQDEARNLIGEKPVSVCCRHMMKDKTEIQIMKSKKGNFQIHGVMRCGSVWKCPICGAIITLKKRRDLIYGIDFAIKSGLSCLMLTLTVPHHANDKCADVTNQISAALIKFYNRETWKGNKNNIGGFARELSVVGHIRTLDVVYTKHGWHPHFHIILVCNRNLPVNEYAPVTKSLLQHWKSCCVAAGLTEPDEHGLLIVDGANVARYVTKWGLNELEFSAVQKKLADYNTRHSLNIELEIANDILKTKPLASRITNTDSYTPFEILQVCSELKLQIASLQKNGNSKAADNLKKEYRIWGARYREYCNCFHGRRQLVYSRHLRKLLGLVEREETDKKLANATEQSSRVFAIIPEPTWRIILSINMRGQLLEACRRGESFLESWILNLIQANKLGTNQKEKKAAFKQLLHKLQKDIDQHFAINKHLEFNLYSADLQHDISPSNLLPAQQKIMEFPGADNFHTTRIATYHSVSGYKVSKCILKSLACTTIDLKYSNEYTRSSSEVWSKPKVEHFYVKTFDTLENTSVFYYVGRVLGFTRKMSIYVSCCVVGLPPPWTHIYCSMRGNAKLITDILV